MEYSTKDGIINLSTRQPKYGESSKFEENLKVSHELVNIVSDYLSKKFFDQHDKFIIRSGDDVVAYKTPSGRSIRLWDIETIYNGKTIRFECKDFCRCVCYQTTGLPKRYVDKILERTRAEDIYIIFRDNPTFIEQYIKIKRKNENIARDILLKDGFFKTINGEDIYVPYGEKLSVLMNNRMVAEKEQRVKSSMDSYNGEEQYMWNLSCMKTLGKIVEEIKG